MCFWGKPCDVTAQADTCRMGLYITSLYDLKMSEGSFKSVFYLWFQHTNPELKPLERVEMLNAQEVSFTLPDAEFVPASATRSDSLWWSTQKVRGTFTQEWDVVNFPFDQQRLVIHFEHDLDTSSVVLVPDTANSSLDSHVQLGEWNIRSFRLYNVTKGYETSYGDPGLPDAHSGFSRLIAEIVLDHRGTGLFWKLFTGVYVAFVIAVLAFFLSQDYQDSRFGLAVGALFAAVGNKYIVDSLLPETTVFTLVDKIHAFTFGCILLTIVVSVISLRYHKAGNHKRSARIDRIAGLGLIGGYLCYNLWVIMEANSSAV